MKYFFFLLSLVLFISCAGDNNNTFTLNEKKSEETAYPEGKKIYNTSCVSCHQKSGLGLETAFPPLAKSDYLLEDKFRAIEIAANGMEGEIVVNGVQYNNIMAPQGLSNEEVKHVVNYILNSWGNDGGEVTDEDVAKVLGER